MKKTLLTYVMLVLFVISGPLLAKASLSPFALSSKHNDIEEYNLMSKEREISKEDAEKIVNFIVSRLMLTADKNTSIQSNIDATYNKKSHQIVFKNVDVKMDSLVGHLANKRASIKNHVIIKWFDANILSKYINGYIIQEIALTDKEISKLSKDLVAVAKAIGVDFKKIITKIGLVADYNENTGLVKNNITININNLLKIKVVVHFRLSDPMMNKKLVNEFEQIGNDPIKAQQKFMSIMMEQFTNMTFEGLSLKIDLAYSINEIIDLMHESEEYKQGLRNNYKEFKNQIELQKNTVAKKMTSATVDRISIDINKTFYKLIENKESFVIQIIPEKGIPLMSFMMLGAMSKNPELIEEFIKTLNISVSNKY